MKKLMALVAVCTFIFLTSTEVYAWFGAKKKDGKEETVQTQDQAKQGQQIKKEEPKKIDKAKEQSEKERKALTERKLNELNNTEWQIELSSLSGKGKKDNDIVQFKNKQVYIGNFSKRGFPATNFTLTVQQDGSIVWETMQTSDKSGIAFWRGEMDAAMQTMRGILSHQIDEKTKEDFSFISLNKRSITVASK